MNNPMERNGYKALLESGTLPKSDLDRFLKESDSSDTTFSQLLIRSGMVKESDLLQIYSRSFGIPYIHVKSVSIDKSLMGKVPVKFATYYKFFPIKLLDRKLTIAVSRLFDVNLLDEIRFGLGYDIEMAFAPEKDIEDMLNRHYGLAAETVEKILNQSSNDMVYAAPSSTQDVQDIERLAEAPSVVQLVNQIILEAYKKRASDIHLEPFRGKIRLRYRIDGELHEQPVPAELKKFYMSILSRIKIMANLNIVERRLPQDGKARVKTQDQTLDLRISSIPTPHGESMVIRILPSGMILDLESVGFEDNHSRIFKSLIRKPHGIIFVTGPTGSGKSTTLYAGLNAINTVERKIITIEDPVEYELEGIAQLQVSPEIGLSFSRGLRSMLRHDPDVMMVGEVRDLETADIAIRVALTGHLILSTLHTNDAASGVTRLLDIGVEPYLVSSSVIGFVAQRLVRVICQHCKHEDVHVLPEVKKIIMRDLGMNADSEIRFFKGKGCDECHGSGFLGRMAIHEILLMNEDIRRMILNRSGADQIKLKAMEMGLITLRQDGWIKVLKGLTTPEEIMQTTPADEKIVNHSHIKIPSIATNREGHGVLVGALEGMTSSRFEGVKGKDKELYKAQGSPGFNERRSYQRVEIDAPVKFRAVDLDRSQIEQMAPHDSELSAKSSNVSASGIAFLSRHPVAVDMIIELTIELPDGGRPIQCIGRVSRITKRIEVVNPETQYKIGVAFLAIPSVDRARIQRFCRDQGLNEKI